MKDSTARALNELNRSFYEDHGTAFARTRGRPWAGFARVLELYAAARPAPRLRVLDAGCGHARLARWLFEVWPGPVSYTGFDASEALLARARDVAIPAGSALELVPGDWVEQAPEDVLPAGRYELCAAFGVLHHVPGQARRRALLEALARRLAPSGWLVVAFWDFARDERLRARIEPWSRRPDVDPAALEAGDHLLRWGDAGDNVLRYAHDCSPAEERSLLRGLPGLELRAAWAADGASGALNRYRALRRTDAAG